MTETDLKCRHCNQPLEKDRGSITGYLHANNSELICVNFDSARQRFHTEPAEPSFAVNPEPLQVVPENERHGAALAAALNKTPSERKRAIWIALGGDPAVWDKEH